jgi:endo-1,4-beta-xylanase
MKRVVPPRRLAQLVAIGASALLAAVVGLALGFAGRDRVVAEPPAPADACPEPGPCAAPAGGSPLRVLAEARQLIVGSAVNADALAGERYRAVLGREFSAITPEHAMKWSVVEPARGVYRRAAADQLIAFAQERDQRVYGHALVWHRQVPAWVTGGSFSDQQTAALLRAHVRDEVGYFRDRVWAWDVVNEALDEDGALRDSLWLRRLGPGYLADAFRWARAADPDAKLFINDYAIEGINPKSDALYDLVARLVADDVPIDGVGFQLHWNLNPLPGSFVDNLRRFAALGVDVAITELDVRIPEPVTAEKLARQADLYGEVVDACLAVARCVSVTVWGFSDAHSWVPRAYPGKGAAAMFDEDLLPKPAYDAVSEALRQP